MKDEKMTLASRATAYDDVGPYLLVYDLKESSIAEQY